jgi:DDE superfamily endonuclease
VPLDIRPTADSSWARAGHPERHPATYHRTHGVRYFHGCYSVGDDTLWGVNHRKKGAAHSLAALQSTRAARPDSAPIYDILDNLSAHKGDTIRRWAKKNRIELCFSRPALLRAWSAVVGVSWSAVAQPLPPSHPLTSAPRSGPGVDAEAA